MSGLRLVVAGISGRMGRAILAQASQAADLEVIAGLHRPGAAPDGLPPSLRLTQHPTDAATGADVWLDVSRAGAVARHIADARAAGLRAAVVGVTGLTDEDNAAIAQAAKDMAVVQARNFSLGVTLLAALTRRAAAALGSEWDIEIAETHHRAKVDAPSGTALALGEAAAAGRGEDLAHLRAGDPSRMGARKDGSIGFAVSRGGGVPGDHAVSFLSASEVVTLSHRALDRDVFARGALVAARWAAGRPPGLYGMADVLGLEP